MSIDVYIYSRYDTPGHPGETFVLPTMTQQQFKDDCDVNNILRKYMATGILPTNRGEAYYGDFTDAVDYKTALESLEAARASFAELPSSVRREFDNDPYKLLEFLDNPANTERAIELGLAKAPESSPAAVESAAAATTTTTTAKPAESESKPA